MAEKHRRCGRPTLFEQMFFERKVVPIPELIFKYRKGPREIFALIDKWKENGHEVEFTDEGLILKDSDEVDVCLG